MSTDDLRLELERLAGPPADEPDTAWIRRRAAKRRRHRRWVHGGGLALAGAATAGLLTLAVTRDEVPDGPMATAQLPAVSEPPGSDVWAVDAERKLFDAARRDDAGTIAILLESGVDPDATSRDGITALIVSAFRGDAASVDVLIAAGAAVDAANDFDATALQLAAQQGHVAVLELLIDAGADPNRRPTELWGVTPLMEAARFGRTDAVDALLQHGASPDLVDEFGRPTVFFALDAPDPLPVLRVFRDADVVLAHPSDDVERSIRFADHPVGELVDLLCELDVRGSFESGPGADS